MNYRPYVEVGQGYGNTRMLGLGTLGAISPPVGLGLGQSLEPAAGVIPTGARVFWSLASIAFQSRSHKASRSRRGRSE